MVQLVRAAQRAGHDVVVSSGGDLVDSIARLAVRGHRSGWTAAETYARMPGRSTISDLPPEEQQGFAARHLFGAGAVERARDVADLMKTWLPDLVVHDMMELGSATAAVIHGVPHVTHGYGPAVPGTAAFLAGIASAITDAGLPDPVPGVVAAPYLEICPPGLAGPEPGPWATIERMRPSAGEMPAEVSLPSMSELPYADTVYCTLGTVMNGAPDVFRAVIDGAARVPVNLIVTTGPGFDQTALGPVPRGVMVEPYLPQAAVLPLCRAVVSHAGAGTMLGALCHGLPQLCLPQSTDQPFNTAALLRTGAGLALEPGDATAGAVSQALERLLHEPEFARAAARLRHEIDRMPSADAVLDRILPTPA